LRSGNFTFARSYSAVSFVRVVPVTSETSIAWEILVRIAGLESASDFPRFLRARS